MIDFPRTAAIFDLDGTLLDTLEDLYLATNQALTRHSLPARTRDEVRMFVGNGVEMLIRRAVPAETAENTVAAVLADFKAIYATICEDHTAPYPGIIPLLTALRARGIRAAVVSNKFDAATKQLCQKYFGDLVEIAVGERAGIRKKPAPDTVFEVLRQLELSADSAVYIGDSDVDIETARGAGMPCLSVTWGLRNEDFLIQHGATVLVHTPEELLELLVEQ
ncbi:MAG: HAD family hydrolase [Ruminococcaceae bacterium]|nr:HAD family hydrolase [Oscillospiraceae bacterium]